MTDNYYNEVIKITVEDTSLAAGTKALQDYQGELAKTKAAAAEFSTAVVDETKAALEKQEDMYKDYNDVVLAMVKQRNFDEIAASIQHHQDLAAIRRAADDAQAAQANEMDMIIRASIKAQEEEQLAAAAKEQAILKAQYEADIMLLRSHDRDMEMETKRTMALRRQLMRGGGDEITPFQTKDHAGHGSPMAEEEAVGGMRLGQGLRTGAGMLGMAGSFQGAAGLYTLERIAQMAGVSEMAISSLSMATAAFGATLAAITVPAGIMYLAHDFAHELAEMSTTIRGASADIVGMSNSLNSIAAAAANVSAEYNISTTEAVKSAKLALQSGIDAADVPAFMAHAAELARAVRIAPTAAAEQLTALRDAYTGTMADMTGYEDVLANISNLGRVDMSNFGNSIGRVLPLAQQAGVALQELGAIITTQTRRDSTEDQAVTNTANMIKSLVKPSKEAAAEMAQLGIEFGATALKGKKFSDIVQDIITKTHGDLNTMMKIIPDIRGERGLASLVESLPLLRQLEEQFKTTGVAAENASRVMSTTGEKIESQWNSVAGTVKLVGLELLKFMNNEEGFQQNFGERGQSLGKDIASGLLKEAETIEGVGELFITGLLQPSSLPSKLEELKNSIVKIWSDAGDVMKGNNIFAHAISSANDQMKRFLSVDNDYANEALARGHEGGIDAAGTKREDAYNKYKEGEADKRMSPAEKDQLRFLDQQAMEIQHHMDEAQATMHRVSEERVKDIQNQIQLKQAEMNAYDKGDGTGDTAKALKARQELVVLEAEQDEILRALKREQKDMVDLVGEEAKKLTEVNAKEKTIRDTAAGRTQSWKEMADHNKEVEVQTQELYQKRKAQHEEARKIQEATAAATKQYEHEVFQDAVKLMDDNIKELKKFNEKKLSDIKKVEDDIRKEHEKTADVSMQLDRKILEAKNQQLMRNGGATAVFRSDRQAFESTLAGAKDKVNDGSMTESGLHSTIIKLERLVEDMAKNDPNKSREVRDLMEGKLKIDDLARAFTEGFDKQQGDKLDSINSRSFKKLSVQDAIEKAKSDVAEKQKIENTVNLNIKAGVSDQTLAEMVAEHVKAAIDTLNHRGNAISPIPTDQRNTGGGDSYQGTNTSNENIPVTTGQDS